MKTHLSARGGALALCLALGFATGPATHAAAQTKWNLPGAYAADNYHSENLAFFAKEVEKETGGKLHSGGQPALLKAAAAAKLRGWRIAEEKASWYLDQLRAKGMKVEKPNPALMAGLKKLGEQLTADWIAKAGPTGKGVVDAYLK
jgi:TRAP-type C4-dicarboxylate transport system substrate-binding protein